MARSLCKHFEEEEDEGEKNEVIYSTAGSTAVRPPLCFYSRAEAPTSPPRAFRPSLLDPSGELGAALEGLDLTAAFNGH